MYIVDGTLHYEHSWCYAILEGSEVTYVVDVTLREDWGVTYMVDVTLLEGWEVTRSRQFLDNVSSLQNGKPIQTLNLCPKRPLAGDWTWTRTTCWKKWEPFWKICEQCARQNGENLKLTWFCKGFFYMTPAWGCGAVIFLQYLWASNQSAGWFLDGFLLTGGFGLPLFSVWEQMLWRWSTRFALPLVLCTWHEDCMVYDLIADPLPEAAKPFGVSKYLDKCMSVLAMSECTNIIKHSHRCHSPSQVRSQSICKSDVPKQYFCTLAAATLLKSTWICLIRGARTLVEDPPCVRKCNAQHDNSCMVAASRWVYCIWNWHKYTQWTKIFNSPCWLMIMRIFCYPTY